MYYNTGFQLHSHFYGDNAKISYFELGICYVQHKDCKRIILDREVKVYPFLREGLFHIFLPRKLSFFHLNSLAFPFHVSLRLLVVACLWLFFWVGDIKCKA